MRGKTFVLLVQFLILQAPAMSELEMRKLQILSWLCQNVKLQRQVQRDQEHFDHQQDLHLGVFIGRPTRLLPHDKMLLVPINCFLCWVDYALEGSTFSLSKCDFSRLFHTERSWHCTHIDLLRFLFLVSRICPLMQEQFLWPLLKSKVFYCSWIRVLLFSKVPSVSE